ncbi:Aste57867_15864 [Aphanomyces stellatus]|uniref:Aste57867_15864 protein n=1 Tax=Aphanomyces stellatus TaxID=120398 RepID=A0A485L4F1_9STRA|nr:hypothetical protein As57867_015808 [Aphanomyces stellatus]VFT92651.1 Aste57867_15864 [Aphanomyces stellatus]
MSTALADLVLAHPYLLLSVLFAAAFFSSASVRQTVFVWSTYVTLTMWYQYRQMTKSRRETTATPPPSLGKAVSPDEVPSAEHPIKSNPTSAKRAKPRTWAD